MDAIERRAFIKGAAIGTFAASTSTAVQLEVNRTGLTTALVARTWLYSDPQQFARQLAV